MLNFIKNFLFFEKIKLNVNIVINDQLLCIYVRFFVCELIYINLMNNER
jgi:hypothetical protein